MRNSDVLKVFTRKTFERHPDFHYTIEHDNDDIWVNGVVIRYFEEGREESNIVIKNDRELIAMGEHLVEIGKKIARDLEERDSKRLQESRIQHGYLPYY